MSRNWIVFLLAAFTPLGVRAQSAPSTTQPAQVSAEDGGGRGRHESIVVPPKQNAPFTITLGTEWVRRVGQP